MKFGFYGDENKDTNVADAFKKIPSLYTVKFRLEERSGEISNSYVIGKASYLTEKGMYIKTDKLLPSDAMVDLRIIIPPKYQIILAQGVVIWIADENVQSEDYPGIGVKFSYIKESDRKKIQKLLL